MHLPGTAVISLDRLSRDSVPKLLCQHCYVYLLESSKSVSINMGAVMFGHTLSEDEMRQEQNVEFGNLQHYTGENSMIVDQGDSLPIEKHGDLSVVALKVSAENVLAHMQETSVSGQYRKGETFATIRKRLCWKT